MADYAKAVGGLANVDAIETRQVSGRRSLLGKVELYWQKPNKVLMVAGKEKTAYNGSAGWFYSKRKKISRLSHGLETPIQIDANPLRYVHLRQMHSEVDAVAPRIVGDTLMEVLTVPNDLAQATFYFDAHTHLLARIEEKGETSAYFTETYEFADYQSVDNIQFPFRITHKSTDKGAAIEDFRINKVQNNIRLNSEIFSKPESTNLVLGGKR